MSRQHDPNAHPLDNVAILNRILSFFPPETSAASRFYGMPSHRLTPLVDKSQLWSLVQLRSVSKDFHDAIDNHCGDTWQRLLGRRFSGITRLSGDLFDSLVSSPHKLYKPLFVLRAWMTHAGLDPDQLQSLNTPVPANATRRPLFAVVAERGCVDVAAVLLECGSDMYATYPATPNGDTNALEAAALAGCARAVSRIAAWDKERGCRFPAIIARGLASQLMQSALAGGSNSAQTFAALVRGYGRDVFNPDEFPDVFRLCAQPSVQEPDAIAMLSAVLPLIPQQQRASWLHAPDSTGATPIDICFRDCKFDLGQWLWLNEADTNSVFRGAPDEEDIGGRGGGQLARLLLDSTAAQRSFLLSLAVPVGAAPSRPLSFAGVLPNLVDSGTISAVQRHRGVRAAASVIDAILDVLDAGVVDIAAPQNRRCFDDAVRARNFVVARAIWRSAAASRDSAGAPRLPSICRVHLEVADDANSFTTAFEFGRASVLLEEAFARYDIECKKR